MRTPGPDPLLRRTERESHSNSCSVVQPRNLLFHFTSSDRHKGPSLYLHPGSFLLVSWAAPFSFSKACKWLAAAIQIHFTMTGSLGPLFLRSFVCQTDYCNISRLQDPHLSLWWVHGPNLTAWFLMTRILWVELDVKAEQPRVKDGSALFGSIPD